LRDLIMNALHGLNDFIIPISIVVGSFILGFLVEKYILGYFKRAAAKTGWEGDDIILASLNKYVTLWFVLIGIFIAIHNVSLSPGNLVIIKKLILVIFIFSATVVMVKILSGMVDIYARRAKGAFPSTSIFTNITKVVVYIIGGMIILQALDISITPILTALGVGGLAVALALQDTLSNLFAGIQIIASRQVKPGDYVKLDSGEEGYVVDITWRNTTIRALPNNMIIVPNAKLSNALITNYYMPEKELAVLVNLGVSYSSDLNKVERVTIEVAREVMKEVPGGVPDFEPFVRYHTFGDFSINFTVVMRAREFTDQYLIKHEFIKRLHQRYIQEGIEIPFPVRTVYMKDVGEGSK